MGTETITIRVDAEAAEAFKALPEGDRKKLEVLLGLRLNEVTQQRRQSLDAVTREISEKARERGLTPEVLKSLLDEK